MIERKVQHKSLMDEANESGEIKENGSAKFIDNLIQSIHETIKETQHVKDEELQSSILPMTVLPTNILSDFLHLLYEEMPSIIVDLIDSVQN